MFANSIFIAVFILISYSGSPKDVSDKLCIAFCLENKYLFCMFLSQIREQNLSDKALLNNELIFFKACSSGVVFNIFGFGEFIFVYETCLSRKVTVLFSN